jgi:dTDP-L-rhamnose 4-epimerase
MNVLISGGAGFIGSHTAEALIRRGDRVRALDCLEARIHPRGGRGFLPPEAELVRGDVRSKDDWIRALDGMDTVVHLAAYQDYLPDFSTFFHVNAVGTALLYEVVVERRIPIRKILVASSQAVYGEGTYRCAVDGVVAPEPRAEAQLRRGDWEVRCPRCGAPARPVPCPEDRAAPHNQYAISKHAEEMLALNLGQRYGIPTVALRYSIVQGPRQSFSNVYSGACRVFALALSLGRSPLVYEDGAQLRDYVNIEDVVRANVLVLDDARADSQVFNVGAGRAWTVLELYRAVARAVDSALPPRVEGAYRFGDTRHILSDVARLTALGWAPRHPIEKSAADYVAWLRTQTLDPEVLDRSERRMAQLQVIRKGEG